MLIKTALLVVYFQMTVRQRIDKWCVTIKGRPCIIPIYSTICFEEARMESNRGSTGTFLSTHKVASENRDLISGETSTVVCLKFSKLKHFYFNCEFILILLLNASSLNDRFILLL